MERGLYVIPERIAPSFPSWSEDTRISFVPCCGYKDE